MDGMGSNEHEKMIECNEHVFSALRCEASGSGWKIYSSSLEGTPSIEIERNLIPKKWQWITVGSCTPFAAFPHIWNDSKKCCLIYLWESPIITQGCRLVPCYIFGNKPRQMVPKDLDIGETRVWRWFKAKSTTLIPKMTPYLKEKLYIYILFFPKHRFFNID